MKSKTPKQVILAIAGLVAMHLPASAQEAGAQASEAFYNDFFALGTLALAGVVILAALVALFSLLNAMIRVQQLRIYQEAGLESYLQEVQKPRKSLWDRLYKQWTKVVPVEKEEDILFDHEYDGIRELDNSLPPWWVALFVISGVFAVVYMTYYHFAGIGESSAEAYVREVKQAEEEVEAYLASQANLVDETTVVALTGEGDLATGQTIFQVNCASCHGQLGEGGIGPNMTDPYWVHGGSIQDVFKTIKYGVPEKGMISWKSQLRPIEMQQVASYILTLQGTNPPNPKAPEGELYQAVPPEGADMPSDSTQADASAIGMLGQE